MYKPSLLFKEVQNTICLLKMTTKLRKFPLLLTFIFLCTTAAKLVFSFTNETDHYALLAIKDGITEDPLGILNSWNNSIPFCDWTGVICSKRRQRVLALDLPSLQLAGSLSSQVGNLSFLRLVNLADNHFRRRLPEEIGLLCRLQNLILSNNSLQGELPKNLTHSWNLSNISGPIPDALGQLPKLTKLGLAVNCLTGKIPPSLGNLSLSHLFIAYNPIEGSIPQEVGKLSNLHFLQLAENNLSGEIPASLYNITSMKTFSAAGNNLTGVLPADLFLTLPKLQELFLGDNRFFGPIPHTITNACALVRVDLSGNSFRDGTAKLGRPRGLADFRSWWQPSRNRERQ